MIPVPLPYAGTRTTERTYGRNFYEGWGAYPSLSKATVSLHGVGKAWRSTWESGCEGTQPPSTNKIMYCAVMYTYYIDVVIKAF